MHCPRELIRMGMATKPAIVIYSAFVFVETEPAFSAKVPSVHCSPHIMRFLRYRGRIASRETHSVAIGGNAQRGIPGKLQFPYLTSYIPVVPSVALLHRVLYFSYENIKTESDKAESGKQKNEREYYHRGIVSDCIQNVVLMVITSIFCSVIYSLSELSFTGLTS